MAKKIAPSWMSMTLTLLALGVALTGCGIGGSTGSGSEPSSGDSKTSASRQDRTGGPAPPGDGGDATLEGPQGARAAQCYVDAVNDEDLDALVGCFAPDGTVVDVSRRIEGRDEIHQWAQNEVIGGTLRVIGSEPRQDGLRLLVHWAPAGSDGWRAYYTFEARDAEIMVADLQYA